MKKMDSQELKNRPRRFVDKRPKTEFYSYLQTLICKSLSPFLLIKHDQQVIIPGKRSKLSFNKSMITSEVKLLCLE